MISFSVLKNLKGFPIFLIVRAVDSRQEVGERDGLEPGNYNMSDFSLDTSGHMDLYKVLPHQVVFLCLSTKTFRIEIPILS